MKAGVISRNFGCWISNLEYVTKVGQKKVGMLFLREHMRVNALYKYTTLFGRVRNGCSCDFKFAAPFSKFQKIL